jgi:glycosyltransferase involved in cell wall biosynthesis
MSQKVPDNLPKVSIVTPSYNQAQFLEQTIQSVLSQDYPNLEYIIVDGGSTDGSVDIIRRYAPHLAWWVSERDCGQSDAVNKGWRRASGEIIGWLNSDDLLLPGAVSRMVAAFQETPGMGIIYGDVFSINSDGDIFNIMQFGDWNLENLMQFDVICQPGAFLDADVLKRSGMLEESMHFLMDHHLWLKMAQIAPIRYLPGVVAAARFHPQAKNVGAGARYGVDAYRIVDWMKTQPILQEEFNHMQKRVWAGAHRISARYLLDGGDARAALRAYFKSLMASPHIALQEWHRMLFAALSVLGLGRLKDVYYTSRLKRRRQHQPDLYRNIKYFLTANEE